MANVKISALPPATTVASTDLLLVVQGGATKQTTPDLLPLSAAAAAALAGKAGLASPAFTGSPTIGGTTVAKTTDITAAIAALVGAAPAALDTLKEIDDQLTADEGSAAALATLVGTKAAALTTAATRTASATAAVDTVNPVDTTGAPVTITLPTPTRVGQVITVEKVDTSTNLVTIAATLRGAATSMTISTQYESILLVAESLTSWRPVAGHKTKAALDATYLAYIHTSSGETAAATTARLNAALAAAAPYGTRKTIRLTGDFTINAPLVIGSNTLLDARDATVTLTTGSNSNMLQSAAYTAARTFSDTVTTAASTTVTSASAVFTSADVGKAFTLFGTGITATGNRLDTTISSVTNATTAVLTAAPAATSTNTVASVGPRDSNVEILGGTWIRAAGNGTTSVLANNSFQLRRVDGLKVTGYRFQTSDGKYAISLADVNEALIDDGYFITTASDGVHINGPCQRVTVRRQRGNVGDDLVAFTSNDTAAGYGTITDTIGPMSDILIDECYLTGLANAGATPHAAVIYGDVSGTYPTTRVKINSCADQATTAQRSVQLSSAVTEATVTDCKGQVVLTTQPAANGTTTPQTQTGIRVRGHHLDPATGGATSAVLTSAVNLTDLTVDGLTIGPVASGVGAQAVTIGPGTVSTRVELRGVSSFTAQNGRLVYVYGTGTTVTEVAISSCRLTGTDYSAGRVFAVDTSATVAKVFVAATRATSLQTAFAISQPAICDVHTVNSAFSAIQNFNVSAANVRVHGVSNDWGSGTNAVAVGGKFRSLGDWNVDVSLLDVGSAALGDQAINTNNALACGLGLVAWNGATWQSVTSTGPALVAPSGQFYATSLTAWYTANAATFLRFHQPAPQTYRWVNLRVGTQSGNIQAGVVKLVRSGTGVTGTLVASSGVVACPAAGDTRLDLGASGMLLTPGDYALFLWCDNITATFLHSLISGYTASRLLFSTTGLTSGVPAGTTAITTTTRFVTGLTLETDS